MSDENKKQTSDLIGQRNDRLGKVKKLREMGIDPYPAQSDVTHAINDVVSNFDQFESKQVTVGGRIMTFRTHGKVTFADLQDESGKVQLFIREDSLLPTKEAGSNLGYDDLKLLDVGDHVQAKGTVIKTQTGQESVQVEELVLLSKAIRPIPDQWQGITNQETRYRRRYLDLTLDPTIRERFIRKNKFFQANREFLQDRGFVEVEVPVLEHKTGGADASPFVTHHNDLDIDLYMRISTELYQKRLIGGGFEKVFTIGPNFRNEGLSDEHLQEYYQIEWYWAYADFRDNMELVKEMFRYIAEEVYGRTKFSTRGHEFDLADEWEEIDYVEILKEKLDVDIFTDSDEELQAKLEKQGVKLDGEINRNRVIDNLWKVIRKTLSGPAFLINEPKFMSPLAKSRTDNPDLTERFHVILAGSELGNGYSEINDPVDQLERFVDQENLREGGDDEAQMLDIDYVEMLEYGMPPVSGYGQSERIFWYLEDVTAREGTLFPLMKEEIESTTKKIYADVLRTQPHEVSSKQTELDTNPTDYPTLDEARKLVEENVKDEYQKFHAEMVSFVMREYCKILAEKFPSESENYDKDLWAVTGMVHDWDYEFDPEGHPENNLSKLTEMGYPEIVTDAIRGHKITPGFTRDTKMAQALLAIDEMAGLLFAYHKLKGSYASMEPKGINKKFKDKSFAAKIDRSDITTGVSELGIELPEHFQNMITILSEFEAK